jgi:hypothetical protein
MEILQLLYIVQAVTGMPNEVITRRKFCAPGPESIVGVPTPFGRKGAISATSANSAPLGRTISPICYFVLGDTVFKIVRSFINTNDVLGCGEKLHNCSMLKNWVR